MTRSTGNSRGADLVERLRRGRQQAERAARSGARHLPKIHGLTPSNQFFYPMENVLAETREILIESERVFCYGNMVMMECGGDDDKHLVSLMTDQRIEAGASGLLSNLLLCESTPNSDDGQPVQFAPPKGFVEILLTSEPTIQSLPMDRCAPASSQWRRREITLNGT